MNKERRKLIKEAVVLIEQAKEMLNNVLDKESDAFDNMPENLQGTLRGEESEEAIDNLEEAIDMINDVIDNLGDIN